MTMKTSRTALLAWLQAAPLAAVFLVFFVIPLGLIGAVSFWQATDYELIPAFSLQNYLDVFRGCGASLSTPGEGPLRDAQDLWFHPEVQPAHLADHRGAGLCHRLLPWPFHVKSQLMQTVLFIVCTVPFWTSNVIRMISWVPLLGRNGLVNSSLMNLGLVDAPVEWLLFSDFSVVLAFVHLYTMFMIVPIFNSMMRIDRSLPGGRPRQRRQPPGRRCAMWCCRCRAPA